MFSSHHDPITERLTLHHAVSEIVKTKKEETREWMCIWLVNISLYYFSPQVENRSSQKENVFQARQTLIMEKAFVYYVLPHKMLY